MEASLPTPFLKCNHRQNPESFPRCLEKTGPDRVPPLTQISPLPHQALPYAEPQKKAPATPQLARPVWGLHGTAHPLPSGWP